MASMSSPSTPLPTLSKPSSHKSPTISTVNGSQNHVSHGTQQLAPLMSLSFFRPFTSLTHLSCSAALRNIFNPPTLNMAGSSSPPEFRLLWETIKKQKDIYLGIAKTHHWQQTLGRCCQSLSAQRWQRRVDTSPASRA